MKKIILTVLLCFTFSANAVFVDLNGAANAATKISDEQDVLESYKQGLQREKDKAEVNVKIAELELEVAKLKRETMLNKAKIELMEKNK